MRTVVSQTSLLKRVTIRLLSVAVLSVLVVAPLNSQALQGLVVDSVDNQPLAGIQVTVLDAQRDTVATTQSGPDGRFAVQVPAGAYTLCLRCIGLRPKQVPVEVPLEDAVIVRLASLSIP